MDVPPKSGWTFPAVVKLRARTHGDKEFCKFYDGASFTFRQLDEETDRLASGLARLGLQPGDRVMGMLTNSKAFLLAMIASHKRGAIFVPVNTELKGAFLRHQVSNTGPRIVFVDSELRHLFDSIDVELPTVEATVVVGGDSPALPRTSRISFETLVQTEPCPDHAVDVKFSDVGMIIFTSGTTGPAKGVLMPHAHCFYYALSAMKCTTLTATDRMYVSMPLFHGTALLLQFYSALLAGIPAYVAKRFSASTWLDEIRAFSATVTYAVGVMPEFVIKQPQRPDDADNPLRLSWSVPVSETWGPAFEKRFGVKILQGYGMTEFSVPVWGDPSDTLMPGCAGRVLDEFELKVVDPETEEPAPTKFVGEIVVRPKVPYVFMAGYHGMPEKTVEAWRNLWFHTGDAGYFDEEGRLFYVDRIKDRIRRRGENISAFEIEEVISSNPGVQQCAVVGIKTSDAGGEDEVMAFVVPADCDGTLRPEALLDWCVPRMPRYAVPRFVEFVPEIERTASGKVRKQALRDRGAGDRTWDREKVGYLVPR